MIGNPRVTPELRARSQCRGAVREQPLGLYSVFTFTTLVKK